MQVKGKILAVDDDPNNITIVEELLEDNYNLKTATSGQEALDMARDFRPDIVLLDIMMPGMSGYEVCRKLRERYTPQQTKIIMVSARAMVSELNEGYDAGADDYITKPFDGDEFLEKVRLHLLPKNAKEADQAEDDFILTTSEAIL
jgi:two-component system sensor histidine kinase/response regulator